MATATVSKAIATATKAHNKSKNPMRITWGSIAALETMSRTEIKTFAMMAFGQEPFGLKCEIIETVTEWIEEYLDGE